MKSSENISSSTMSVQNHKLLTNWTFPTFLRNEALLRGTISQSHQIVQLFHSLDSNYFETIPKVHNKTCDSNFSKIH